MSFFFTLIIDGHPIDCIWNIFYHIRIDDHSLSLLIQQSDKLVAMSEDLDSWAASPYSVFLRMSTRLTLSQLHNLWKLYADARINLNGRHDSIFSTFKHAFESRYDEGTVTFTASRSAGIFWLDAVQVLDMNFSKYWRTGTIYPDTINAVSTPFINPTFIYSLTGEGCAVHYGTYPLQGFHLASAFADLSHTKRELQDVDFISCAKLQFQQWCESFVAAQSPESLETVTIRLFAGDALAMCRTLHHCGLTSSTSNSLFVTAWVGDELILDGGDYGTPHATAAAPTTFNVIDTSNIADHVGLMNILIAAVPILSYGSSSTLYTDTLVTKGEDVTTSFVHRLCGEIPAISLLLGVAPTAYVSNFTSHSNIHELVTVYAFKTNQYYERIAWKTPYLGDSVVVQKCGPKHTLSLVDPYST